MHQSTTTASLGIMPPPKKVRAVITYIARRAGTVDSVPPSYARPLNTCYVNRWVRDTGDTPPRIELTTTGQHVAGKLAELAGVA